ncbi:dipeptide ABC transporter ATP-binding protein [Fodinicurvata sediminis]|uniref:dipeptide ABC transporter ATP-binding protein n=1 Tax=Fodinicurvata sediminis TaxID=1121832 RepID=UPI000427861C|nr:ABC transporter ATP-binding protein [Fodinicurvata sediminis]
MSPKADYVLTVDNLSIGVERPDRIDPVLKNISFEVREGQILGVIGESGSGKSVLARALINWLSSPLKATGGSVKFKGSELLTNDRRIAEEVRGRKIGYIGSNPTSSLDPTLSVGSQLVEKLRAVKSGMGKQAAEKKVIDLLSAVKIPSASERFHEYPFQFSGGMMQRVMIVDALLSNPELLICDNITQPLDVTVGAQIIRLIQSLRSDFNTAIIFISSSLPVARDVADEIIVLHEGAVIEQQSPDALVSRPQNTYTIDLLQKLPKIWSIEDPPKIYHENAGVIMEVAEASRTYKTKKKGTLATYNHVRAVRNVSLDIRAGENFGIVGESGCGKSTLTRLLAWLERPDTGSITFAGKNLEDISRKELFRLRSEFQLLLQDPYNSLPQRMAIGRIIEESLRIHGSKKDKDIRAEVENTMNEVGLSPSLYNELPIGLSAGQRQRIAIARALILQPKLMILDETLSSLDQSEQSSLLALFERLQEDHQLTYIFISHDLAMVRRTCNRIAVMYLGEVVELADNHTLFFDPQHPYTRALLSAVPTLEQHPYDSDKVLLEGEPPSPIDLPVGCSFRTRCPDAFQRCEVEDPGLYDYGGGCEAACFLLDKERVG